MLEVESIENPEYRWNDKFKSTVADFKVIKLVGETISRVILQFWAQSGAAILTVVLFWWIYGGVIAVILVFFSVTGLLYHAADQLVYHPSQPEHSRIYVPSPKIYGLQYEHLFLTTDDNVKINAVFIKQPIVAVSSNVPTFIHFHGNAGNIGHRLPNAKRLYEEIRCNVLLVDYRGYGHSEGYPYENGLYEDARTAVRYLLQRKDIDINRIIIFGRSLGGAVAVDVATDVNLSKHIMCVILENTFTCIPDIAFAMFDWKILKSIPLFCYKNKFNTKKKIIKLSMPVLFISGLADGLIPPSMMRHLHNVCSSPMKRIVTFENGSHNDTWQCKNYYKLIKLYLDKIEMERKLNGQNVIEVVHNDHSISDVHTV